MAVATISRQKLGEVVFSSKKLATQVGLALEMSIPFEAGSFATTTAGIELSGAIQVYRISDPESFKAELVESLEELISRVKRLQEAIAQS